LFSSVSLRQIKPHLALLISAGILISLGLAALLWYLELTKKESRFYLDAQKVSSLIRRNLEKSFSKIESVVALYNASYEVTRDEFGKFIETVLKDSSIKLIAWAPRIKGSDRLKRLKEADIPDYNPLTTEKQSEHFPIYFVEPFKKNKGFLGVDITSNPVIANKLGLKEIKAPLIVSDIAPERGGADGEITAIWPVYKDNQEAKDISGFIIGVIDLRSTVNEAISLLKLKNFEVYLLDNTLSQKKEVLFSYPDNSLLKPVDIYENPSFLNPIYKTSLKVGERRWLILCKKRYRNKPFSTYPLITLTGGLITTALLVAYVVQKDKADKLLNLHLLELEKKNRYENLVSTVLRTIHSSTDIREIMENTVRAIKNNIESADCVALYTVDREDAVLQTQIGIPREFLQRLEKIPYPKGIVWRTIIQGHPIHCPDTESDSVIGPAGKEMGIKSYISIPLSNVSGCIGIASFKRNAFTQETLRLLEVVREEIDIAFNNAKYIASLQESKEEIQKLKEELEQRVIERTAQLEEINKELEMFSYSISHDLRAPLRHIRGFTELLAKDISSNLTNTKNPHYIQKIMESVERMEKMIEGVLKISRLERFEIRKSHVNTNQLVEEIISELKRETRGRKVVWKIGNLKSAYADPLLLRLVFVNLISNALKFTRTIERAHIEIGCIPDKDETVYFVRDNGVGFDMRYANRLFCMFQRLHSESEFEGTGIGLVNVKKVISRHGGRVWAEGEINKGATFYFSLPVVEEEITDSGGGKNHEPPLKGTSS